MLHSLNLQTGSDWFPPARLLPGANARVGGSVLVNSVMYVATAENCGGVPNGVYAMDLTPAQAPQSVAADLPSVPDARPASTNVARWQTGGANVIGGPAFSSDGSLYVSTGQGESTGTARSSAVVALEAKTLAEKDYFAASSPFTTSPVTFALSGKEYVAAGNADGRIYLLDAASLGGPDHKSPLATSAAASRQTITGLATVDDNGTRWILSAVEDVSTPTPKHFVAAIRVAVQNGTVSVSPSAWMTTLRSAPASPAIVNGVAFVLATGRTRSVSPDSVQARTAVAETGNPVLSALDLSTGKELWNSGSAIVEPVANVGPAVNDGQVYVVTDDGTMYTFGFVVER
jgi:outer membrane protein assembly factor BamB